MLSIQPVVYRPIIRRKSSVRAGLALRVRGLFLGLLAVLVVSSCGGHSEPSQSKPATSKPVSTTPIANISASSLRGQTPFTVNFDGKRSTDDKGIVRFEWDFGDGTSSSGTDTSHTFPKQGQYIVQLTVTDADGNSTTDTVTLNAVGDSERFKLFGTVSAMPYMDVDGDTNDPNAPKIRNNGGSPHQVQPLANPVLLSGYLTFGATGGDSDAFGKVSDVDDVYSVVLEEGEYASLKITDPSAGDIDLFLLDASNFDVIASSTQKGELESVRAPQSAAYYVMARISNGATNYVLKIGEDSFVTDGMAAGQSGNFEPMEAVVKLASSGSTAAAYTVGKMEVLPEFITQAQIQLTHAGTNRATLARLNPLNPQTAHQLKMRARGAIEQRMAKHNPRALAKLHTLHVLKQLRQQRAVEYAELNYTLKRKLIPNDPHFGLQWSYPVMNLPKAWDVSTGDSEVIVAVLDSGVYKNHTELSGQLVPGYDFVANANNSNDGDGIDDDPSDPGDNTDISKASWHGTHVAGAIVAKMNNGIGIAGVAPNAKVMPLRVLGLKDGSVYDVLQAVRFAAGMENDSGTVPQKPASIINLSLGGMGFSQTSQNLYNEVRKKGIFVVAASGNENSSEPLYPASYKGVISVGAYDYAGKRAHYSNYNLYVDVSAPGGSLVRDLNGDGYGDGILSLTVSGADKAMLKSNYAFYQGTSVAAPHVSGIIALMKSTYPELTPDQFDSLLINGEITDELGEPGHDKYFGHGGINAHKAVQSAQKLAGGELTAAFASSLPELKFDSVTQKQTITLNKLGRGDLQLMNVEVSEPWLNVVAMDVDANGVGTYDVYVDRDQMSHGTYSAVIVLYTSAGTTIKVEVTMRIGDDIETGRAGRIYILLFDAETDKGVASVVSDGVDGEYPYVFNDIPVGNYYVVAGTDTNNNGLVCDAGEICGHYPNYDNKKVITVKSDYSHLNFSTGLFEAVDSNAAGASLFGYARFE